MNSGYSLKTPGLPRSESYIESTLYIALKKKKDRPVPTPRYVAGIFPLRNLLTASQQMPESSLRVVKFITENPQRAASMSIGELARGLDPISPLSSELANSAVTTAIVHCALP